MLTRKWQSAPQDRFGRLARTLAVLFWRMFRIPLALAAAGIKYVQLRNTWVGSIADYLLFALAAATLIFLAYCGIAMLVQIIGSKSSIKGAE
jgi:hypothetical protein